MISFLKYQLVLNELNHCTNLLFQWAHIIIEDIDLVFPLGLEIRGHILRIIYFII